MFGIKIICVGRLKEKFYEQACFEYIKRVSAFAKIHVEEIKEVKIQDNPSENQIFNKLAAEGRLICGAIPNNSYKIALCIEGESLNSTELSYKLEKLKNAGISNACFILGGSLGIADEVKKNSDFILSMSKMTFPHNLARVMLLEQLYRAFSISENGKYHK